jgi:hypothetical protein
MMAFDTYQLDVVVVTDAVVDEDEDEVRDMFLRLQNGTTLKAQEKRNAMTGAMRNFVKAIANHPFFENCRFTNQRFTFDHIAAQVALIEIAAGPSNVKDADLNRMYRNQTAFDPNSAVAKKIRRVLDFLYRAFPERTPELERYNVINLYCLISVLLDRYVSHELEKPLAAWFLTFEQERSANEELPEEERDVSLVEYRRLVSQSTDAEESIQARLDVYERRFFEAYPDIEQKDPERTFSHEQRLAIFRRDEGICQPRLGCNGERVTWGHWHADHRVAHALGGKTTVANGQVACIPCNLAKGMQTQATKSAEPVS